MSEVTGHSRLEFPELAGHRIVRQGNMEFEYGPLALAMKFGGLCLLNEIDLLEPSTAAGLNGILDGQPMCIPENGGERILPHPMFRFAATANSNGGSDGTGLYQGVLRQNLALMDRFWLCEAGYPQPEAEEQLLEKTSPQLPDTLRKKMVEFANEAGCQARFWKALDCGDKTENPFERPLELQLQGPILWRKHD